MRFFFTALLLIFSFYASAQDAGNEAFRTDCGLDDEGSIKIADGTICDRDIAFGLINEIFPSLVEEIKPLWSLNYFSAVADTPEDQVLLGDYHGDEIFFTLSGLFYALIILLISVYLLFLTVHGIVRVLKGGSFINANSMNEDDVRSWAVGGAFAGIFLLPYKSFFVGQLLVFSLGTFSLTLANMATSVFYAGNQSLFKNYTQPEVVRDTDVSSGVWERHSFMADSYYRYLTSMSLCQQETVAYKVSASSWTTTTESYESRYSCEVGDNEDGDFLTEYWTDDSKIPPFGWYDTGFTPNYGVGKYRYSSLKNIVFETKPTRSDACLIEGDTLEPYHCGGVTISNPNWTNNPLIALLDEPSELFDILESMESGITADIQPTELKSLVSEHWTTLKALLEKALAEKSAAANLADEDNTLVSVDNEVMETRAALNRVLEDSARSHYQSASRMLHQAAMNALLFGSKHEYEQIHSVRSGARKTGSLALVESGISSHFQIAKELAKWIRRGQCLDFQDGLEKTQLTVDYLNGESDRLSAAASARCLDIDEKEVLERMGDLGEYGTEEYRQQALARFNEIKEEFNEDWTTHVELLTKQRRAIESSFSESVQEGTLDRWWVDVRQKGYLAVADYLKNINQVVESYKNDVRQITNTYQFMKPNYNSRYVSASVDTDRATDAQFMPYSYAGDEVFNSTYPEFTKVDPLVSSASWMMQREMLVRQKPLDDGSHDMGTFKIFEMFSFSEDYLDRLGISFDYTDNDKELCLEDPSECPFPLSDPIVELTLLGHDMLDVGIEFFSIALPSKAISKAVLKRGPSNNGKTVSDDEMELLKTSMGEFGKTLFGLVDMASASIDIMYDLLGTLMVGVTIIGAVLAYVLPVIPQLYLYMKFVSWFMVVVMASFSVLLWCIFMFRFKEKRELIKSAGLHYGVEIMFSPTLSVVTTMFAYYFFYVVAFAVGVSSLFLEGLPLFKSTGVIRHYFDLLFSLVLIFFIFIMGLRYTYQLMEDMLGELLTRLGVNHKAMDDKIGDFVKAMLFDKGRQLLDSAHAKTANQGRREVRGELQSRIQKAQSKMGEYNEMYGGKEDSQGKVD
ncbi:hypothetical protein [Alteromonas sp. 14N.309.X.WAT.G.H12]|uniref:hypothetical protein n=1 Tax=Alteromonas sp. 14N.309.X.WAT.G.H12 TaxID=3120824 RepID=UPI002FCFBDCA